MIGLPLKLSSCKFELDLAPDRFGSLRRSDDAIGDFEVLKRRAAEDGYLFIPGFFNREDVIAARESILASLSAEGFLDPAYDWRQANVKPGAKIAFRPDLAMGNPTVEALIYSPKVMNFYGELLGGAAMHYDYTWLRAVAPGGYTEPHYDIVYMGRGTKQIFTAWVPMSDINFDLGGLIILEGSHRLEDLKSTYGTMDVDEVCANKDDLMVMKHQGYHGYGALSENPREVANHFNLRWLTSEYRMGDLLTFSMYTLHASTDNQSNQIRLSTDSRYQLASEPADERWIGEHPLAHGGKATRKLIC